MITMTNPCTPHRDQLKRVLEPSPAFSNYFSDDESSPSSTTVPKLSPSQSNLLGRLNAIGRQILRKDPGEHERSILSAELDALEQTLNAPEPQSREPPDIDDSGLFVDDGPEDETEIKTETEESSDLEASVAVAQEQLMEQARKRDELVIRVERLNRELRKRYEEIKVLCPSQTIYRFVLLTLYQHINDLAIERLESSAQEILKLRSENHKLQAESHHSSSDFLFLKMQLRAIEVQAALHMDSTEGSELKESVEQWKMDWKAADARVKHLSEGDGHGANGDIGLGMMEHGNASDHTSSSFGSPQPHKSRLTITRPGLIARHGADPFVEEGVPNAKPNGVVNHSDSAEPALAPFRTKNAKTVNFEANEEHSSKEKPPTPPKTPWQELWDGLADFAGIYDQ